MSNLYYIYIMAYKLDFVIYQGMTLNNVYPTFIDLQKTTIKNINILYECKESKDVDRLLKV